MKKIIYLFGCFVCLCFDVVSQNQCLDASFGNAGILQVNFGNDSVFPKSIAIQQDGKIIVGSDIISSSNRDFMLSRFTSDGTIDSNFGVNGHLILDFNNNSDDFLKKIIVQTDGKILIGGNSKLTGFHKYSFIRLNVDGSLDFTFGINGKISHEINVNSHHFLQDMVITNADKIAIVGHTSICCSDEPQLSIYWNSDIINYIFFLNTNGDMDSTFSNSGTFQLLSNNYEVINKIALTQNQDVIFSGYRNGVTWKNIFVGKLNQNGNIDSSFGNNGFTEVSSAPIIIDKQLFVDENDKIFVQINAGDNGVYAFNLAKLSNSGAVEINYISNYFFQFDNIKKNFKTFLSNGSLINLSDSYNYHDTIYAGDFKLFTLNSQGNLASNVCGQGEVIVDVAPDAEDRAVDALMQVDNKFVQLGSTGINSISLIRYLNTVFANNKEFFEDEKVPTIYPNPVGNSFKIKSGMGQIQISDVTGRAIQSFCVNQNEVTIDVSNYAKGVYFVAIIVKNQQPISLKFIKE
jgi:uncharacterized delta-60 repeat protein